MWQTPAKLSILCQLFVRKNACDKTRTHQREVSETLLLPEVKEANMKRKEKLTKIYYKSHREIYNKFIYNTESESVSSAVFHLDTHTHTNTQNWKFKEIYLIQWVRERDMNLYTKWRWWAWFRINSLSFHINLILQFYMTVNSVENDLRGDFHL